MYAIYYGDQFIDLGTKKELADKYNIKTSTINFYMSPAHRKRTEEKSWIVIKIEEDEEK